MIKPQGIIIIPFVTTMTSLKKQIETVLKISLRIIQSLFCGTDSILCVMGVGK